MKKNISINISGIIFHIEEDGYDKLKNYLDSINRYFSTFDDSHEIIADIEGRIAEIFLSKLKDGRQVVSLDDVESLMATMGSVRDFQAVEEESDFVKEEPKAQEKKFEAPPVPPTRKIYRDGKRKILGGVLAGLAHYLNIDPLWVRLIYLLLFFGISVLESVGPILFILYIALWIIFPVSYELEEEEKLKKMYRDPDNKVLGGVCGGISAYFGIDVVVIRLLFFISIFFVGTGVILYIILWVILPEAITITDKMKMKGQPVTLSNIEMNIKKSFNVREGEENIFVKILLFPFRLIAMVFDFLGRAIGPLLKFVAEAIRIFIGVVLLLAGTALILGIIVALGVVFGVFQMDFIFFDHIPLFLIQNDLNWVSVGALFFALVIPFIFLIIAGLITLTRRKLLTATIGWSLLALWLISIGVLGFRMPQVIADFAEQGYYTEQQTYDVAGRTLVLNIRDAGDEFYQTVDLNIKSTEEEKIKIVEEYKARGVDMFAAEENAQMVDYTISQNDSIFTFDSNLTFKNDAKFRGQELYITLHVPEGQKFKVDRGLNYILGNYFRRKGFSYYYDVEEKTWFFQEGNLRCEGCEVEESRRSRRSEREYKTDESGISDRNYDFQDFSEIEISGNFKVKISQADEYLVELKDAENNLDRISVEKRGGKLRITGDDLSRRDKAVVNIHLPELEEFEVGGSAVATIYGFSGDKLLLRTRESTQVDLDSNIDELEVEASGSSGITLFGKGDLLIAQMNNASTLNAFDFYADRVVLKATGASETKIYGEDHIEIEAEDGSKVEYRGNARVEVDRRHDSKVEKK